MSARWSMCTPSACREPCTPESRTPFPPSSASDRHRSPRLGPLIAVVARSARGRRAVGALGEQMRDTEIHDLDDLVAIGRPVKKMFSGFRSRCTMPDWCAALRARRICSAMCTARAGTSGPDDVITWPNLPSRSPWRCKNDHRRAVPDRTRRPHSDVDSTRAHRFAMKPHHHVGARGVFGLENLQTRPSSR